MDLGILSNMAKALAAGDLIRNMSDAEKSKKCNKDDEIGKIGKSFDDLIN